MTGLSLRQGQKFPELIHQFGQAAQKRAMHTGNAADEAAAIKNASTWEGEGGEAAREALGRHITTFDASKVKDNELAIAAWAAELRATDVAKHIKEAVDYAESKPYPCHVDEDTNTVSPPDMAFMDDKERKLAEAKYAKAQNQILQVLGDLEEANTEFANAIKAGTGGEIPPGVKEGSQDAQAVKKALAEGKPPPPEVLDRIKQITDLSPEQKKAWEAGKLTIPQSSMDYLNSFSRSMDGQNIQQLKDMMVNKVSEPDARNMMNGFQMISDPKVQAPGKDGMPRMQGSFDRLPDGIKNVAGQTPVLGRAPDGSKVSDYQFHDYMQDRQDLAAIMNKGGADFMHGSDLDRAVLKQAGELLDKTPGETAFTGDGKLTGPLHDSREAIQSMLSSAGRDNLAVHDLVAGTDGHTPNNKLIGELMTQHWNDGGSAAGHLASNAAAGNSSAGLAPVANDPTQFAAAQRAGETVHAFDQYVADHGKELSAIEKPGSLGMEKEALGSYNPELTKELARGTDPFLDDAINHPVDNTAGFDPLDKVGHDANMPKTRDLMGILESNPEAAQIMHGAVDRDVLDYQKQFTDSVTGHQTVRGDALDSAARLLGLDDTGSSMANAQDGRLTYDNAKAMYDAKSGAFDTLSKIATDNPTIKEAMDNINRIPGGDTMLKDMLLGKAPDPYVENHMPSHDFTSNKYYIAQELFQQGYGSPEARNLFQNGFPSYDQMVSSGDIRDQVSQFLGNLSPKIDGMGGTYQTVMPHDPPKFGH
ncbi:WxG100-family domain protein [Mycobacterium phage Aegeus]|nr:WxG100-family domain protein [Mycobacterium phage Baudelaire]WKW86527.1 WxG100-family domain protein [Mycobacterium phage Aegeus]